MRITTIPARTPVRPIPRAPDDRRGGPLAPLRRALAGAVQGAARRWRALRPAAEEVDLAQRVRECGEW